MRRIALLAVLLVASSISPARADGAGENEQKAFTLGLERFRAGDARAAIDIWSKLLETIGPERGWRVTYNLGRAYDKLGDPTRAMEHFTAFLGVAEKQEGALAAESAPAVKDARARVAAIERSHGVLEVSAPPRGVVVVRLGLGEPRAAGFRVYLKPGKHVLTFRPGSPNERSETLEIKAGEKLTRAADEDAPAAAEPTRVASKPTADARPEPQRPRTEHKFPTLWVAIGASATVVASGVSYLFYRHASSEREHAADLGTKNPDYASAKDDYESAKRTYQLSLIAPILIGTATLTLVGFHLGSSEKQSVSLGISPSRATLSGSF